MMPGTVSSRSDDLCLLIIFPFRYSGSLSSLAEARSSGQLQQYLKDLECWFRAGNLATNRIWWRANVSKLSSRRFRFLLMKI